MTSTKKISDNALSYVSGGTAAETADDSRFLNVLLQGRPGQCDRYGEWRVHWQNHDDEITRAWATVGVTVCIHSGNCLGDGKHNVYMAGGKFINQEEAREYAMNFIGKHITRAQWDW